MRDKLIYMTSDKFGTIRVLENKQERFLLFDTPAKQSAVLIDNPVITTLKYQHIMQLAAFFDIATDNMLFLGLGGGCMPLFFYNSFPSSQIQIVEIRNKVVDVAEKYFSFKQNHNLAVTIDDAANWILNSQQRLFNIIMLDAYDNLGMPNSIHNLSFIEHCHKILAERGVLVVNYWLSHIIEDKRKMEAIKKLFDYNYLISDVDGCDNKIYFLFKNLNPRLELNLRPSKIIDELQKYYDVPYQKYLKKII